MNDVALHKADVSETDGVASYHCGDLEMAPQRVSR